MRKLIAIVAASALIGAAPAMAFGGRGMDPEKRIERMQKNLSLTDAQTAQARSILESKRAKMEALKNETQAEIRAILTPEQQAKHDQNKAKWEAKKGKWLAKRQQRKEGVMGAETAATPAT